MDVKMNPSIVNTNNKLADDCSSTIDDQNTCTSPKRRRSETFQPDFDSLPFDVQEEIECLYEFVPEVEHHFTVLNKIGEGTFSSVFLARLKHYPDMQQMFALKHIIPTSHPSRIEGELQCLQEIGGCDNVMGVELCIRNRDHVVIVMPYFPHEKFQDYLLYMSVPEVRDYMKNLLIALRRVHKFNIIHRDVKPSNFLYHRTTQQYTLVDFGLAHKVSVTQKTKSSHSPQCRTDTSKSSSNRKPLSPSKKHLQAQNLQNLSPSSLKKTEHVVSTQENLKNEEIAECKKLQQFTTPTPDLNNRLFTKKVKSPRRLLLAKRAILLKERETTTKDTKDRVSLTKTNPGLSTCQCYGKAQVCTICTARNNQQAPRAGTPGFRSPEVLLKCPDQTTAVDIWSAGVIFLSLLSGRYPFFRANDDMTALAQIISILGSEEVVKSAESYGKQLICNPSTKPLPMKNLCARLRSGPMAKSRSHKGDNSSTKENEATKSWSELPDSAYDLLSKLMDLNPYTRISADEALKHEFFTATS